MLSLLLLLLLIWGGLHTEWGQNFAIRQVTKKLSKDLNTEISIQHVDIELLNKLDLQGVLIRDQKKDTLLHAGGVQISITDWFFFKEKAELKYIGLTDATVHLNRTDSVWNYQFLADYFASTNTSKKQGIEFDLKTAKLQNVVFIQKDAWAGSDMTASVSLLELDAEEINFAKQIARIRNLNLVDPVYIAYSYAGKRPPVAKTTATKDTSAGWNFLVAQLKLANGRFKTDNQSPGPKPGVFDSEHMDFTAINGNFKNVGWVKDTVKGFVDFSAKERSGLVVKRLKANTTLHGSAMIFDDLDLQTNRSTLTRYFAMRYPNGMSSFEKNVKLEAHFNNATLASDDIGFFAPEARNWKRVIRINGDVKGTIDDLKAENLELWAGNKTYINGNASIVGLPNINETFINLEAKALRTTYEDAVNFFPALRKVTTPNLRALGYLNFKGVYTGFITDFVTYGTVQTALGTLTTDLNMKLPKNSEPVYSGRISTGGFQLGRFLNNSDLGIVDFNGTVKGRSFDWNKLDLNVNGNIRRFQFGDYTFQNIVANGRLNNKKFNGFAKINDPNVQLTLNGLVDLSGSKPLFNAKASITSVNLKQLGITKEDVIVKGVFDVNLNGGSLSDLLGNARINEVTVLSNGKTIKLDSFVISSRYVDGLKTLQLRSNEFDATITGQFDLNSLPESFIFFLNRYYPSYIREARNVVPQTFTFEINTGVVEDYLHLIDTALKGFNNSRITGSLNTTKNTMTVDADIPQFSYKQYQFSDVSIKGSGDYQKLVLTGQANNAIVSETINFPQTNFTIEASNDVSDVTINTISNQTINNANLAAQIKTFSDGATISFKPSSFTLNGKPWSIEQGGELNFRKNTVVQGQVILRESQQEIQLATHPSDIGNWNDLQISLRNINLGDIAPFVLPKNRLEGMLNGDIVVEDPQSKFNVRAELRTEELRLDNDSIGQVQAAITYNNKSGMLTGEGRNLDPDHRIDFDLALDLKDSANTHRDRISLHPRNFQLKYLERFLGTLFTDIEGFLTGDINIVGEGSDRDYLAKAKLTNAAFKVVYTQVPYRIEDTEIELTKDAVNLNGIRIRDRKGNLANVDGYIQHKGFANMYYDIRVKTASRQMELLNTGANDNPLFFGRAWGSGEFNMVGPQSDMLMNIDVKASETDSSWITLPPSNNRKSGQASFMVEKKYGTEMNPTNLRGSASNLKFNVTLTANPFVNMNVILDELTGDEIKGRGSGVLSISSGTTTPLTINGRYNVEEGNYLFTFQSLLKKPFELRKNSSSYIEWTGDPYKAKVQLEAVYTAENVSFSPLATLLSGSLSTTNVSRLRENVFVIANLSGELFQPKFDFRLEFPGNSPVYRDPSISFGIQQIERNPAELTKQVSYLILFNSFAPYESFQSNTANTFNEAVSNTISGILFGEINRVLNQALSKVLQRNNITLNLSGSLYNRNLLNSSQKGLRINQGDVNIVVGKSFFEGKVIFNIGGTFDVPLQDVQQTIQLFPDVSIDFLISKSGSVRATVFYKENVDFLTSSAGGSSNLQTRRYGASISYGRELDMYGKKARNRGKKKEKQDSTIVNTPNPGLTSQGQ